MGEGGLGTDLGAGKLLAEGQNRALGGSMGVAGAATAGIEATGAGGSGLDLGRNTGGRGSGWSLEEVSCTAAARVGVAVLSDSGMRLVDEVGGRHFGWCDRVLVTGGW